MWTDEQIREIVVYINAAPNKYERARRKAIYFTALNMPPPSALKSAIESKPTDEVVK